MNVDSRSDPSATSAAPASDASAAAFLARCNIDASARAGGSAQQQDWLREQRRKLEDERYRLKC